MKITVNQLRKIIKEEVQKSLKESHEAAPQYKVGDIVLVRYADTGYDDVEELGRVLKIHGPWVDLLMLAKEDPMGDDVEGSFIEHTAAWDESHPEGGSFVVRVATPAEKEFFERTEDLYS